MGWSFTDDYDERYFEGNDMAELYMDTFYMNITYSLSDFNDIYLYKVRKECVKCPYIANFPEISRAYMSYKFFTNLKFRIATEAKTYFPQDENNSVICDIDYNFQQFGVYNVDVNKSGCHVNTLKEPVNIYSPILTVFLIYLALFGLLYGFYFLYKKWSNTVNPTETKKKERIKALDTFRGITIVLMIFANFGCGGYEFIEHAIWNGLHLADLVFPSFMWIMGVCIPISLSSSFKKGVDNGTIMKNVLRRSLKLFGLGIFVAGGSNLNYLRIFGVLQRFGVAYFVVTTICLFCMSRKEDEQTGIIADILKIGTGWIIALAFIILHTIIIFTVAAPGCPTGYMGPGGLHENQSYVDCIGGATGYVDGLILGNHRYQQPTIYEVYEAKPFDPEGIVGCLSTIFQVFLGVQAGITVLVYKSHYERLIRWLIWAVATGIVGGALCGFSKEDGIIPVNKNLWSLSFVMVTSCCAFTLLSACYFLVDVKKLWSGKPFLFAGMNAILMYIGHEMTDGHFPIRWYINNDLGDPRRTHFLALLSDTWGAAVWVLVAYYFYKINYFFTV